VHERTQSVPCGKPASAEASYPQVGTDAAVAAPQCFTATPDRRDRSSGRVRVAALLRLCDSALAGGLATGDPQRYQVVVHVDARTAISGTAGPDGLCELDSGWAIPPATAQRLACDADLVRLLVDGTGSTLDAGRKTRVISRRLRRALAARDRHCRVPGCDRPVTDWHHVRHWLAGGPTDRANLVGLCEHHHTLTHTGQLIITSTGHQTFQFHRSGGVPLPEAPAAPTLTGTLEQTQPDLPIDNTTLVPDWYGEHLDLDETISVIYLQRERNRRAREAS
jgi:hypothetical protein